MLSGPSFFGLSGRLGFLLGLLFLFLPQIAVFLAEDTAAVLLHVKPQFPGLGLALPVVGGEVIGGEFDAKLFCQLFPGLENQGVFW